ncbi:uncharacterized protein LOC120165406 [Hibiscus syriacus]|uniref:uncharacterized protein LOC120165406 n=1 Tax=Hibiscus syriacus TaxID=106335 RepID=UPI0019219CD1|nr:uncharacterized protein LOC120165406 [Hibiscus syriacus]
MGSITQAAHQLYGDVAYLLDIPIDRHLFRSLSQFWNPAYSCFTFGKVDLTPTIEEYRALICCPRIYEDRAALKEVIYHHADKRKQVDMLALGIYGLIIFPKILGHLDILIVDLFEKLNKNADPVPTILAETFRSLNSYRREGEGRFIGCAPLLLIWILNYFKHEERAPGQVFLEGYAPLMVSRQYGSRQFILATSGLSESEFAFRRDQYKENIRKATEAWKWIHRVNLFTSSQKLSPEYEQWRINRVNENIPVVNFENVQTI